MRCAFVLGLLVFGGFGTSVASLVRVQFVQGEEYRAKAELRQLLDESTPAKRGTIYDINGKVLAESASVWKIYINPKKIAEFANDDFREDLIKKLSDYLNLDEETVRAATFKENTEYWEVKKKSSLTKKKKLFGCAKSLIRIHQPKTKKRLHTNMWSVFEQTKSAITLMVH